MAKHVTAAALLLLTCLAASAHAQAGRHGPTFSVGGATSPVIFPDVAHDPTLNRYFKVSGNGFIEGHLLDASGAVVANLKVNGSANYAQTPRVAFSPHIAGGAGGYLVTWHESIGNSAQVRGRFISGHGAPIGNDIEISPLGSFWIMGAALGYATGSSEFLVVWMGNYGTANDIFFQRLSVTGERRGGAVPMTATAPDWERDPSVAYNPHTDQFYIAYAGYVDHQAYAFVAGRLVQAGTGAFASSTLQLATAVSALIPSVTYNPNTQQYLVAWYHQSSSSSAIYGQVLSGAGGSPVGGLRVLSAFYSAYDALDVDFNPLAGEYVLVTHGSNHEDAAVTVLGDGTPYDNGFLVTQTAGGAGAGNYHPRIVASGVEKKWLVVTSYKFGATYGQFLVSNSTGTGTSPPPPAPPPPPPVTNPKMSLDVPFNNSSVAGVFSLAGWAVDLGDPVGSGVSTVHVWAFPASGASPIFLGVPTNGISRPDVGAAYGARFTTSGFSMNALLHPGSYNIAAYAFSKVTGTFNNSAVAHVTVVSPPTIPRMAVDLPAMHQTVSQNFTVAGWALDLGALTGSGVDAIHVWAYPIHGGSPVFAGATTTGVFRPDVAAAYGDARFGSAGYGLTAHLPPGEYNLVVFAHSTVAFTFNNVVVIRIRVV